MSPVAGRKAAGGGECLFCRIAAGDEPGVIVFETRETVAFLDKRPLFPGHTLLVPRLHFRTLTDVPPELAAALMRDARLLAGAVEQALEAEGTFVAMNNRVSQSVPHLHIHIVPRRKGDGLRGFFWPRQGYRDESHREEVAAAIRAKTNW